MTLYIQSLLFLWFLTFSLKKLCKKIFQREKKKKLYHMCTLRDFLHKECRSGLIWKAFINQAASKNMTILFFFLLHMHTIYREITWILYPGVMRSAAWRTDRCTYSKLLVMTGYKTTQEQENEKKKMAC